MQTVVRAAFSVGGDRVAELELEGVVVEGRSRRGCRRGPLPARTRNQRHGHHRAEPKGPPPSCAAASST